ncbi:hypothetical protein [Pragia fontium]|uniref:hypothetical protein n=1 Tax=Pragia fontium TaxID=82985 RepID=UPI000649ED2E|nr:hypothetical protein [Pragia fontium]AKJ40676.1 hypothetical protein QQ39_00155 [Pragia fontium]
MNISNNKVIDLIELLEVLRVALARIGATYAKDEDKLAKALCYFIIDYQLFKKVSSVCKNLISEVESNDDMNKQLEDFFDDIEYWKLPDEISNEMLSELIKRNKPE